MREMKNSGIEWIGVIPTDWDIQTLKYQTEKYERGTAPDYTDEIMTKVVNQATFSKGYFDTSNIRYSSKDAKTSRGLLKKGDVLLASTGGGVLGKTHFFNEDDVYVADSHVTIVRTIDTLFSKYLYYYFSINYSTFNAVMAEGSTNQTELQRDLLGKMPIPFPPIEEQQAISAYLDKKCSEINSLISDIQQQIETLEEYKRSVITEAVTKGLAPDVEMRDSGIEWIGNVPENWEHNTVLNCIDFEGGSQPALNYFIGEEKEGYIRLIQNRDYKTDAYKVFVPISMVSKFCDESDVMIGRYGPPLFVLHRGLKGAYNVALMKAIPKLLDREYMAYYLQNYTLIQYIESFSKRTAGQSGVNTDILKKYPIYVPPMYEQKQISDYLDKKCTEIDSIISEKKQQIETIEEYKKSLIFEYVTGKKEVNYG